MIILALGCLLLGAVFGRLFKVWILLPTFALLFALACANRAILEFVVLSTCLQLGYVSGLRFCVICDLWRRRPPREPWPPAAQSDSAAPASYLTTRHH
jgi:hypothetical protein